MKTKFQPELEAALSDVVNELESNQNVQMYKAIAKSIDTNAELNTLWSEKRIIQKELIHAKQYQLFEQQQYLTARLDTINHKLEMHPLIRAYNELHEQIVDIQKEIEEIVFSEK